MTDAILVARLQRKDSTAYDELVAQYGDVLYGYIYQSTLDQQQSEALLGATFARVVERIDYYRAVEHPLIVWLYRIAHTVTRDRFIATPPKARMPQQAVEALDTLPLEERQVIMLRCVADMSLHETGYVLAKSNSAVKQLQFQALRAMHTLLR